MSIADRMPARIVIDDKDETGISLISAVCWIHPLCWALSTNMARLSTYHAPEHWRELENEQIRRHPLEYTLEDMAAMSSLASLLVSLAKDKRVLAQVGKQSLHPELLKMRDTLKEFSHWFSLARERYSRHQDVDRHSAFTAHQYDGSVFQPPEELILFIENRGNA